MNPGLTHLQPYPFERLATLLKEVTTAPDCSRIALTIGEPQHAPPELAKAALIDALDSLGRYPPTIGSETLRQVIADWLCRRFALESVNPATQVLPVNGTREALFAIAQVVVRAGSENAVVSPNPFYQIYEGAALLAGTTPRFIPATENTGFIPDYNALTEEDWARCELLYLCTPGNPSGATIPEATLQRLIQLADEHDFVIASDECYSEIYRTGHSPPPGLLQAAAAMGRHTFERCLVFHSLSKRSNLPGLRSGFVAGDAALIDRFRRYRIVPILNPCLNTTTPEAGFYLWPETPVDDEQFAKELIAHCNVAVLPGKYLARTVAGHNPGSNRVRMALVAEIDQCVEAAQRIAHFLQKG
jgi:N-succinyldiaminopimelate aminotransferase